MDQQAIAQIVSRQREFFLTGATLDVKLRVHALKKLRAALIAREKEIAEALKSDLGKSAQESYMCETGMVISEISYMLAHIRRYAREATVPTPLAQFASRSYVKPSPYGVTLIMSPWNYPLLLTLDPLVSALAAGNTAVVKPSAYAPATGKVIENLLGSLFAQEHVAVVMGGRTENNFLLEQKFDYIFFTGSKAVGQLVLERAAKHLTPVTLELGGKSPCIVDKSADIALAARRIAFGKFLNCGQTCVAPDYILCHASVKDALIAALCKEIAAQYGSDPLQNENYGKMISARHYARVCALIDRDKVVCGGACDEAALRISPTVMDHVTWSDAVMQEEIFGPVLPVLTFEEIGEVIAAVRAKDTPLALYIFAQDKEAIARVTGECAFGGGCINDVVIHLATSHMGFGGMGESGMGAYHGKTGFDTFTHYKSIVDKKTWIDLPMRYQPYRAIYDRMVRFFLR